MRAVLVAGFVALSTAAQAQDVGTKLVTNLNAQGKLVHIHHPPFRLIGSADTPQGTLVFISDQRNFWFSFVCHALKPAANLCYYNQTFPMQEGRVIQ